MRSPDGQYQSACCDHRDGAGVDEADFLAEQDDGEDDGEDDAELVDRCDF